MAAEATLWPWLAVAAAGALHGLNPIAGWAVAAWQERTSHHAQWLRMLLPIAAGNVASVLVVAAAVPMALELRREFDPLVPQGIAAVLLLAVVVRHFRGSTHARAGLGLWSFIVATAHGAGWMLVPALVPLCATGMPGARITASGSALLAMAAVAVHLAGMLAVTMLMTIVARGFLRHLAPKSPQYP